MTREPSPFYRLVRRVAAAGLLLGVSSGCANRGDLGALEPSTTSPVIALPFAAGTRLAGIEPSPSGFLAVGERNAELTTLTATGSTPLRRVDGRAFDLNHGVVAASGGLTTAEWHVPGDYDSVAANSDVVYAAVRATLLVDTFDRATGSARGSIDVEAMLEAPPDFGDTALITDMAIEPSDGRLLVAIDARPSFIEIDPSTLTRTRVIALRSCDRARATVFEERRHLALVACDGRGRLAVIDLTDGVQVASADVVDDASSVVLVPGGAVLGSEHGDIGLVSVAEEVNRNMLEVVAERHVADVSNLVVSARCCEGAPEIYAVDQRAGTLRPFTVRLALPPGAPR